MGAVHELSKVTGSLEHRMDDLERSHETVAVRLSRLKRGGSIISNLSSSSGSDAASACEKIRQGDVGQTFTDLAENQRETWSIINTSFQVEAAEAVCSEQPVPEARGPDTDHRAHRDHGRLHGRHGRHLRHGLLQRGGLHR